MKNYNMILIERLQKYHLYHLTGEEILHSNQQQIIEQAKFSFSPLGKAFEKQKKLLKIKERKKLIP